MEDAKVLSSRHRAAGFYGLMALSALSALGSFWLSVAPPVLRSPQIEREITESLQSWRVVRGRSADSLG